jgi:PAS domain S-box-containing protein
MPQCLCWGPDLLQVYNDGYRVIMGEKHPAGFAKPVLQNWAESAVAIAPLLHRVLAGETVYFEDLAVPVHRDGVLADAYFTFSYSPVLDDAGDIGGVLINCSETTAAVAGRRAQGERDRLTGELRVEKARLEATFQQSPSFFAILRGPENVFEAMNAAYAQIVGQGREVLGKPLFEALPETRGQGFDAYLATVRETGEALVFRELPARLERTPGVFEERFIDITYLPLLEADGTHSAVIAHGTDVTDQVLARRQVEQLLAGSEAARVDLSDANLRLQDQQVELELTNQQLQENAAELEAQAEELMETAASLEARTMEAERARRTLVQTVEAVTDGFIALDADFRYTYVNRRACEMWGMSADALLGRTPYEVFADMDRSPFVALMHRVRASQRPEELEEFASSLHRYIEFRAYPLGDGGIVAFFADRTEARRTEEAGLFLAEASRVLAVAQDYQSTLHNLAAAAVPRLGDWCAVDVLVDPDGALWPPKIERVAVAHRDPAKVERARQLTADFPQDWSRTTGTPGVIRTRQPLFYPAITDEMLVAGAQSAAHTERLRELGFRSMIIVPLVARDRVLGAITLVMSESGRRFSARDLEIAEDLGGRAGVAIDNARLLRDTAAANTVKTEFLRTVSHELRQPLNAIRGYLDLWRLGLRGELSSMQEDDVERLVHNQEHLKTLIEDLLSFTRLDAGRLEVEQVHVPIAPLFGALEAMIRPEMDERRVAFSYEPCPADVAALGDRDRIIQICLNLITNAMRATAAGGRVSLRCSVDADTVALSVADTGRGVAADKLGAIFEPFTQIGRALNAPKEGAGLGLAISRGLAEAMGGTLEVESELGVGSTFSLRLQRSTGR